MLLVSCLQECADGRWGLVGQNEATDSRGWLSWPEADRLKSLAAELKTANEAAGSQNELWDQFLNFCSLRGPQVPGEPKLAAALLASIDASR